MNDTVERLRQDLQAARLNREQLTVDTLQAALTRITNAEAIPAQATSNPSIGVGATEAPRKVLSPEDIKAAIQQELDELTEARTSMAAYPDHPYAADLTKKIAILSRYM